MPLPPRPGVPAGPSARKPEPAFEQPAFDFAEVEEVEAIPAATEVQYVDIDDPETHEDDFAFGGTDGIATQEVEETELAPATDDYSDSYAQEALSTELPDSELEAEVRAMTPEVLESVGILLDAIAGDDSSEVLMNGPTEVMMKRGGQRYIIPDINLGDADTYHRVINKFILPYTDTKERINAKSYLIEAQMELPDEDDKPPLLARVHIVAPPVVKHAKVTIAKKARYQYSIDDIVAKGSMTHNMGEFLKMVARGRLTTVFSGLSGAGKTTLLEAMTHEFDEHDRVIVVEDTPELRVPIADTVYMTATSAKPGVKPDEVVTIEWLVKATNRMRPDRIIVGEVRGGEMAEFLIAANSGADGSMTTLHAANPRQTLAKMLGLAMKSDNAKNEMTVAREIASTVQIIVQASLIDGQHIITHIEEVSNTIRQETGVIATTTLFEYDRMTGRHVAKARPSEQLQAFLAQRGVRIDPAWFRN